MGQGQIISAHGAGIALGQVLLWAAAFWLTDPVPQHIAIAIGGLLGWVIHLIEKRKRDYVQNIKAGGSI